MMTRYVMAKTLSISLAGLGASLLPALSFGLGLGDIQIESRLNQPLRARIEIVDVSDEEWRQIRARVAAPSLLSESAAHPEILQALTLNALADASHGHFIEVKSAEVLTEPLFDLPVEVVGGALQVVRNYSVLLDPASTEDAPRSLPASALVKNDADMPSRHAGAGRDTAGRQNVAAVAAVDAQARVAHHRKSRHRARAAHTSAARKVATHTNSAAGTSVANTSGTAASANTTHAAGAAPSEAATGTSASTAAEQQQLQGQLASLQDMLTRMQATIAAQDAEIAKLTAQISTRSQPQPAQRLSTPQVEYAAAASDSEVADDNVRDTRPSWFHRWRMMFYWGAGVVVMLVMLAAGAAALVRRRNSDALRDHSWKDASKKAPPPQEPRSDPLAWQSNLRAAQSGRWQKPAAELAAAPAAKPDSPPAVPAPVSERADVAGTTVATTMALEELTQDLHTDLEALSASYENERTEISSSSGIEAWRAQNEMLERDYLADTEALPFVLDTGNHAKAIKTGLNEPITETTGVAIPLPSEPAQEPAAAVSDTAEVAQARSNRNREVVEILEQSLDFEPSRVDIQLKLLEIYHHEALGNRDNFDSLLRKLAAAQQQLSPAQLLHVENLQRTLRDGKQDTDSDFVAEVAI